MRPTYDAEEPYSLQLIQKLLSITP
jgi:hypothetical protein